MRATGPYTWQPHLVVWVVLVGTVVAVVVANRRLGRQRPDPVAWSRREQVAFGFAMLAGATALAWPLADLAAHWSLLALIVQRLLLILAVPPLLMVGLPFEVLRWLTRPAPVDALLDWVRRPAVAVVWVTVTMVGCLTVPMVRAMASSAAVRGLVDVVVLAAGLVLWLPIIGRVPGPLRIQPWARFAYLVIQAVVPAFLSFIYIFARHPLYPTFIGSHAVDGLQPVTDQQISGFVSKLTMLVVLIVVGAVVLTRAQRLDEDQDGEEPLVWADVERQLERAERHDRRRQRHQLEEKGGEPPPESPGSGTVDP